MKTYQVTIKKDYAIAVMEDLQKMEAVELVSTADDGSVMQQELVIRRAKQAKTNPEILMDEAVIFELLNKPL